ncbi:Protein DEHYDRATION-INDUCED 19 3 [Zea mays]|uniref:Protein DEHYDRATION-INDUCED 19 3 n=1 Tax=Zea mays TaxID=4577 RepID=A0A3L6DUA7_MAIZE|nr:Protein DEHYDRATION-INDUCED 19 3 [Zea mays]
MDSEHWISRLAAAKRYYAAQLGHVDDVPGIGTEEVEMEIEDDGGLEMEMEMALGLGDATWPDVACPYCYEDHDVASLCVHLEEDHPYEPHSAVSQSARFFFLLLQNSYRPCPICSQRVTRDMLNHMTMQHGYLFKELQLVFLFDGSIDSSLTSEEREQKRKQATGRATFVQGLVLSTLFGD